ncbi:hypothetical protein C0993_002744, partial [Termitomyces sp. T159_Od127]
ARDDLSFVVGDIITITEENNADWWTGTLDGRSGLFPSAYVEKLSAPPTPRRSSLFPASEKLSPPPTPRRSGLLPSTHFEKPSPPPSPSVYQAPFVTNSTTSGSKTSYRPLFSAINHGRDVPPPPGQGVNSVGLQESDDTEEKKSIFRQCALNIVSSVASNA